MDWSISNHMCPTFITDITIKPALKQHPSFFGHPRLQKVPSSLLFFSHRGQEHLSQMKGDHVTSLPLFSCSFSLEGISVGDAAVGSEQSLEFWSQPCKEHGVNSLWTTHNRFICWGLVVCVFSFILFHHFFVCT